MSANERLAARRNPDGGFGPVAGTASEPEPTALAAIALDDLGAAAWLEEAQAPDGSVGMHAGAVFRDLTAQAAVAMRDPTAQRAAIGWVLAHPARAEPSTDALPHDPSLHGWSWTSDTFGWAEPTAWAVLALRLTGQDGPELEDGIAVLRDRECVEGGWNYGNRVVLEEELPPFVQTTGIALLSLRDIADEPMVARGLDRLGGLWPEERDGVLSLAVATAALRAYDDPGEAAARRDLERTLASTPDPDSIALAWASIAVGEGLDRLAVT